MAKRKGKSDIDSVTISSSAGSVTMTGDEFENAARGGEGNDELQDIIAPVIEGTLDSVDQEMHRMAQEIQNRPRPGHQDHLGDEVAPPPAIQAIDNAADELLDAHDQLKSVKERKQAAEINIMGKMRAAGRMIYVYRNVRFVIDGKETLKIKDEANRTGKPRRETMAEV